LWWLSRYVYPISTLKDLVKMRLLTVEEYRSFDHARHFLWNVRAWLHYLSDRAEERLSFDKQHAVAEKMGFENPSMNRAIERFMRRYFVAVRTVGSTTRIFCALLEEEKKRKPRYPTVWSWGASSWGISPFRLDGERLSLRNENGFEQDPVLMLELFRLAQDNGLDIHPRALRSIGQNLPLIDDHLRHDSRACSVFLDILLSKKTPEMALCRMSEAGILGRFIPEFGRVVGQTQFNMYHVYTVDEHTLVAIGLLNALELGHMQQEAPLASDLFKRIKMRRVLFLALFCHDIAKGQGGDHSHLGEKVVSKLAKRLGFSRTETQVAAWLVRQHLLFSNTAFKRDLNDPKTISDFVEEVQTPERMRLLLILTVADIRAVGPAVWNEWKASLLRDLYTRAEHLMGAGSNQLRRHEEQHFSEQLKAALPGWSADEIHDYLQQTGASFLAGLDVAHHAAVARMLRQAKHSSEALLTHTQHDVVRQITEIIICTPDQHGLFSKITGAMALGGANIINAKIFTLKDGMAVEIFQVQDASGAVFDRADRLARLSVYLEQALSAQLDLSEALSRRAAQYASTRRGVIQVEGQVFVDNTASNLHTVIELTGRDRTGFLYDVTQAIARLGLSIVTAHIATFGTQVSDVFYVKDAFGMKITHEAKQKQVRDELLAAIEGKS
jgi:[protein-PII] uridylyltransferase